MNDYFQAQDFRFITLLRSENDDEEPACPYDDINWVKDKSYSKDPNMNCKSVHRMKIGLRGDEDSQKAYEDALIIAFKPSDSAGWGTGQNYDSKGKHKARIKILFSDRDGGLKKIHDDTIAGGDVPNCSGGWNYKEYFFDRPGLYTVEYSAGEASGDCAKPSGTIDYKIYVKPAPAPTTTTTDTSSNTPTTDDSSTNDNTTTPTQNLGGSGPAPSSNTKKRSIGPYLAVGAIGLVLMVGSRNSSK